MIFQTINIPEVWVLTALIAYIFMNNFTGDGDITIFHFLLWRMEDVVTLEKILLGKNIPTQLPLQSREQQMTEWYSYSHAHIHVPASTQVHALPSSLTHTHNT